MSSSYKDGICGSTLSDLVCRGHILIANVLKASNEIPVCFQSASSLSSHEKEIVKKTKLFSMPWNAFVSKDGRLDMQKESTTTSGTNSNEFQSILYDFAYLDNPEQYDDDSATLLLGQKFQNTHQTLLKSFWTLFTDILEYSNEINTFCQTVIQHKYVRYPTIESLLANETIKQRVWELFWIYGNLFLLMDLYIPGRVRERLIIAHYRYCNNNTTTTTTASSSSTTITTAAPQINTTNDCTFEDLCKLFKKSSMSQRSPPKKNKNTTTTIVSKGLLTRLPVPQSLLQNVMESLLISDSTFEKKAFPKYKHRSRQVSKQASILCIVLLFLPQTLQHDVSTMKLVIHKFLHDYWILPLYNGVAMNLRIEWSGYTAASNALNDVTTKGCHDAHTKCMKECIQQITIYLAKDENGTFTDDPYYALDNEQDLFHWIQTANVVLKWQLLHQNGTMSEKNELITLVLLTSQFEMRMKDIFTNLIEQKEKIWIECKMNTLNKMKQLSNYYKGSTAVDTNKGDEDNHYGKDNNNNLVVATNNVDQNLGLMKWFNEMAGEIDSLQYNHNHASSISQEQDQEEYFTSSANDNTIQSCVLALDEVQQFDVIDRNDQVKILLEQGNTDLNRMVKLTILMEDPEDICQFIDEIADFSYGRIVVEKYVSTLQNRVLQDPNSIRLLRPFFLKCSSFIIPPAQQVLHHHQQQEQWNALMEYYSTSLLSFITKILDVIPISIFSTLAKIVDMKEKSLSSLIPAKIDVESLSNYSQFFEDRYKLSKITHELSVLAAGIFRMESTLIGKVEIYPKALLEKGLRKEFVRQVSSAHHTHLQFKIEEKKKMTTQEDSTDSLVQYQKEFIQSLSNLSRRMEGFRRAIEYIQDFLNIAGLKVFSDETNRVIGYNLEQEAQKYIITNKINFQSHYVSSTIPIPHYPRTDNDPYSSNFIGRTVNAMMKLTDFKTTIYSRHLNGWLLPISGEEICGIETISLLRRAITHRGVAALDVLLSNKVSHELRRFFKYFNNNVQSYGAVLEKVRDGLFPEWRVPKDGLDLYNAAIRKTGKLMPPLTVCFCRIGQMQLLRKMLRNELRLSSKLDASKLSFAANSMNLAMMRHLVDQNGAMDYESRILFDKISDIVVSTGGGDPMATIFFSTADPLEGLPVLITLFVISQLSKSDYNEEMGSLSGEEEEPFDGWAMAAGISTCLRQFHPSYGKSVFALLGQFVRCSIISTQVEPSKENFSLSPELKHIIIFMKHLRSIGTFTTTAIFEHIPQHLMDMLAATEV